VTGFEFIIGKIF